MPKSILTNNSNPPNDLTGLLLGAGASYDLGMPLVWELTRELKSWLKPEKLRNLNLYWRSGGPGFDFPDSVIEDFASVLEREDMHYENLLGYLQVQSQRHSNSEQSFYGLFMFLSDIVYILLQERHLLNVNFIERNIRYLDGIKTLAKENAPLWIFSLNHDLIIECFVADVGIPLNSGFSKETIMLPRRSPNGIMLGHLSAEILSEDTLKKRGLPFFNKGQTGINLLKIHGSLDVFTFRDGKDVLKLLPDGEGIRGVLSSLRIANQELKYIEPGWPGGSITTRNEIIYADESGEMQFLQRSLLAGAHKFDQRYSQAIPNEMLGYFRSNLNFLTSLICIGYGFGDQHVNELIRDWLEFKRDHYLIIVDPKATHVPKEFLHLATQVELVKSDCTEYLDQMGGIVREPIDQAARRFGDWKRKKGSKADAKFNEFIQREMNQFMERIAKWAKKLPIRYGDIDVEALGITVDELIKIGIEEVEIPSPTEVLDKFLREELAEGNYDGQAVKQEKA